VNAAPADAEVVGLTRFVPPALRLGATPARALSEAVPVLVETATSLAPWRRPAFRVPATPVLAGGALPHAVAVRVDAARGRRAILVRGASAGGHRDTASLPAGCALDLRAARAEDPLAEGGAPLRGWGDVIARLPRGDAVRRRQTSPSHGAGTCDEGPLAETRAAAARAVIDGESALRIHGAFMPRSGRGFPGGPLRGAVGQGGAPTTAQRQTVSAQSVAPSPSSSRPLSQRSPSPPHGPARRRSATARPARTRPTTSAKDLWRRLSVLIGYLWSVRPPRGGRERARGSAVVVAGAASVAGAGRVAGARAVVDHVHVAEDGARLAVGGDELNPNVEVPHAVGHARG